MISRRKFIKTLAVCGVGLGLNLYTWGFEPHWVETVERRLPIDNLPDGWKGARLVHLSDLHIGSLVDDSYLIRTFESVSRLRPEIVVYTGDLTSYDRDIFDHAGRMFARLALGSRATAAVLGNHDYGPAYSHPEVAAGLAGLAARAGVRVLRNEHIEIEGLQIAGMDDLWAGRYEPVRALEGLDPRMASVVLSHNPDTADQPGWGTYKGWILAGHTHGGQCRPPFLPPPVLPVHNRLYIAGELGLPGGRRMYINRGIGHLLPVRFNARPEITVFHLDRA